MTAAPGRRQERGWQIFVLAGSLLAIVATHAPLIGYRAFANVDEAYASALGQRINDGHALYTGAISQRGPLMYYAFAAIAKVFGWHNIAGLRIVALAFALAHVLVVAWAGTRLASRRAGILAAAIATYVLVLGLPPYDGAALHAETMQVPLLVFGAVAGALGARVRRLGPIFLAGLAFGIAISIKHAALLQPLPVALFILAQGRRARRVPWASLGVFAAGVVLVPLACILHAAVVGTLDALVYYTVTYNLKIHLRPSEALLSSSSLVPLTEGVLHLTGFSVASIAVALLSIGFLARRLRRALVDRSPWTLARGFGVRAYLAAHFLVALFSGITMVRFFPHYFVPALPFLAILIGAWSAAWLRHLRADVVRTASILVVTVTLFGAANAAYSYEKVDGHVAHDAQPQRVARWIEATTPPDSKMFVWGFSPWLYQYAKRRPAGRYVFVTYVTGFVPWFFGALAEEPSRVVPGSMDALLGDLVTEDPEIVVDAGSVMLPRPMRAYPAAAAFLHERYCFEVRVGAYDMYRRKRGECRSPFPRVAPPIDFWGTPASHEMPQLVDAAEAKPLCRYGNSEAVWFAGAPPARPELLAPPWRPEKIIYPETIGPPLDCTDRP